MTRTVSGQQVQIVASVLWRQTNIGPHGIGQVVDAGLVGQLWKPHPVRGSGAAQDPCEDRKKDLPEPEIGNQIVNHPVWRAGILKW